MEHITPPLQSRRLTECSESLIPPSIQLDSQSESTPMNLTATNQSIHSIVSSVDQRIRDRFEQLHVHLTSPTNYITNTHIFLAFWFIIWLALTIFQIIFYIHVLHIVKEIQTIRNDWLKIRQIICSIIFIPEVC